MTPSVVTMRVSTVARRPRPAPKGVGRPVGTPLTVLEGLTDPRGSTTAGLEPGWTWLVVVELEDENGLVGNGTAGFGNPATIELLGQLEPLVVGRAPSEVGRVWEAMYRATLNIGRRGVVLHAISAVDIALWDLFGKQLGVPVYELLGGRMRPSLPAYASWLYATEDLDALAAEAAAWAAQGFTAVKQRLAYGPLEGKNGIDRNVELVRTVVDAVGPGVDVMADAYMSWTPAMRSAASARSRMRESGSGGSRSPSSRTTSAAWRAWAPRSTRRSRQASTRRRDTASVISSRPAQSTSSSPT